VLESLAKPVGDIADRSRSDPPRERLVTQPVNQTVYVALAAFVIVLYVSLAALSAHARAPWWDESWFASAGLKLATKGYLGTPVLPPNGGPFQGVDRHLYFEMPLYMVAEAGWFKIVGFGLQQTRLLSLGWGLVALCSWFVIIRSLSRNGKVALLAVFFVSIDYAFVTMASEGRMDMMSAALGFGGLAAYLGLRARHLRWAVIGANALIAGSIFTHPNGVMALFALLYFAIHFDRHRLSLSDGGLAALPYVVGLTGWSLYILQDPGSLLAQLSANSSGRFAGLLNPVLAVKSEIAQRYLLFYAFPPDYQGSARGVWAGPVGGFRIFILVAYAIAFVAGVASRKVRDNAAFRALLVIVAIDLVWLTLFNANKRYYYLVNITPALAAIWAVWVHRTWVTRSLPRWLLLGASGALAALGVAASIDRIELDTYQNSYAPVVSLIKGHAFSAGTVIGGGELGFQLGFDGQVMDDDTLGYYSGVAPSLIVVNPRYDFQFQQYQSKNSVIYQYLNGRLNGEFQKVYDSGTYQVYLRRVPAGA
jgi:hypothetical protein